MHATALAPYSALRKLQDSDVSRRDSVDADTRITPRSWGEAGGEHRVPPATLRCANYSWDIALPTRAADPARSLTMATQATSETHSGDRLPTTETQTATTAT